MELGSTSQNYELYPKTKGKIKIVSLQKSQKSSLHKIQVIVQQTW